MLADCAAANHPAPDTYDAEAGCSKRALFVIDAEGKIAWSHLSPVAINPGVDGVLDALDRL